MIGYQNRDGFLKSFLFLLEVFDLSNPLRYYFDKS